MLNLQLMELVDPDGGFAHPVMLNLCRGQGISVTDLIVPVVEQESRGNFSVWARE